MNKDYFDVLFCSDHVYHQGVYLCALTIVRRTKKPVHFHLMTMSVNDETMKRSAITDDDLEAFSKMIKEHNPLNEVYRYDITKSYQDTIAHSKNHVSRFSPFALIRLYAEEYLPEDIENLIYLDADTMCVRGLENFEKYDISNYELASALDYLGRFWLGRNYFNSGVLYMNMKNIRESNLLKRCRELVLTKKMYFADQDALNRLSTKVLRLPMDYNEQRTIKKTTVISHYPRHVWRYWDPVRPWEITRMHHRYKIHDFDEDYVYFLKNFPFEKLGLKRIEVTKEELPGLYK